MMRAKHKFLYFVLIPLALLVAIVAVLKFRAGRPVAFAVVKKGSIIEAVYGIGTVTSHKIYNVKVNQAGSIQQIAVREGELVKKGAKLITFEGIPFFAPFEGTVVSLPFKTGETVFPQTPLLTMYDTRDLYIVVSLEQQGALKVRTGQHAHLSFDSMRDKRFEGQVRAIFSNDSQFIVHIDVSNLSPEILPGMTTDVGIEVAKKDNVLLAPVSTLNGAKIRTIQRGRQVEVPVKLGIVDDEMVEVESDQLAEGMVLTLGETKKK